MLLRFIRLISHQYVTAFTNGSIEDRYKNWYVDLSEYELDQWLFTFTHKYGGAKGQPHAITITLLNTTHCLATTVSLI